MDAYFAVMAITDLCVILMGALPIWMSKLMPGMQNKLIEKYTHDVVCKLRVFLVHTAASSSAWIPVAMTTQRALSVRVASSCGRAVHAEKVLGSRTIHRGLLLLAAFFPRVVRTSTFPWQNP